MHINVEIKAHVSSELRDRIRSLLEAKCTKFAGLDHQVDTYFHSPTGRLKMREGNIEKSLIHYVRSNQAGPKKSAVTMVRFEDSEVQRAVKRVLEASNGTMVVVDKKREIFFVDNVKFHLDEVLGLVGMFVEIEAIENERDRELSAEETQQVEAGLLAQCNEWLGKFEIDASSMVEVSYSDLLMRQAANC